MSCPLYPTILVDRQERIPHTIPQTAVNFVCVSFVFLLAILNGPLTLHLKWASEYQIIWD
ncbi:hypothetical protein ACMGD3_05080 [Lysinibacillus sphaericus]